MKKYASLYIQTEYSLLSSLISLKKLKAVIETYEYVAIAICDSSMQGAYKFYNTCIESNVKPIIGLQVKLYNTNIDNNLLLYAMNNEGYKSLLKIASMQAINPQNINLEYLKLHNEGILAVIPFMENETYYYFNNYENARLNNTIEDYKGVFKDLYLGLAYQIMAIKKRSYEIIDLFNNHNVKSLALDKVSYFGELEQEAYATLKSIQRNSKDNDFYVLNELEQNSSLKTSVELELEYQNNLDLLNNTTEIIDKCNVKLEYNTYHFPKAILPNGQNSKDYLYKLSLAGIKRRLKDKNYPNSKLVEYKNRLLYELSIIDKMGFNDYFLVVQDYVSYAKKNNIYVGPGRGSAGGSLVSYAIGITEIDPVEFNLLFERFLNPARVGMPDIDVDFEDGLRSEIFKYLGEKYGKDKVAHTSTLGTYKAKLAVRDVSRIYSLSKYKVDEVMKYIAADLPIDASINNSPILTKMINTDEEINKVIRIAKMIEGLPKNYSTHASALIMSDDDLSEYTALQPGIDGLYQTQFVAEDLEKIGLVKMDILGLKNLSIIKNVVEQVKTHYNIDIDIKNIPLDDKLTLSNIAKGNTLGLFQIEGGGVTNVLRGLKCSSFYDIVSATALFRPGPMEMIESYTNRKFGKEIVTYLDPSMEDVLKETYGIIVYQEQIMLIANRFAGYTLGEADVLRKAVSKKKAKILEEERCKFIDKAVSNGKDKKLAIKVYDLIEKFASYGFNKSHAVAYALIAYQMAYLKTYYYKVFMASMMTDNIGSISSISSYISDLKKNNVDVLSPNINKSTYSFEFDEKGIYYPLIGIKEVGAAIVTNILEERNENGLYQDINDFLFRCNKFLNKKIFSMLVYASCFDSITKDMSKKYLVSHYEELIQRITYSSLLNFEMNKDDDTFDEYSFEEVSALENEALMGLNLKYNLFIKYSPIREKYKTCLLNRLVISKTSYVLFSIKRIKEIKTKKGDEMAFITIQDETTELDGVMFTTSYAKYKNVLEVNKVYIAKGKLDSSNDKTNFVIDDVKMI